MILLQFSLQIIKQITAMSGNIERIKKSIADKEGYMALAHMRLDHRSLRPGIELTQDLVEANLVKEIHELRNVAANLQRMLREVCDIQFAFCRILTRISAFVTSILINFAEMVIFYYYAIHRQRHHYVICSKRRFNSKRTST